jgi:hypothetical protein
MHVVSQDTLLRWGVVTISPKPQASGPHLVGCTRLLIQYIQLLVFADDDNIPGGTVHTTKKNIALVVASKENVLEANADKTKYVIVSPDQNAGRSQNITIDNSSYERVEQFKYSGTNLTYQNSIQEQINL